MAPVDNSVSRGNSPLNIVSAMSATIASFFCMFTLCAVPAAARVTWNPTQITHVALAGTISLAEVSFVSRHVHGVAVAVVQRRRA